MAYWDYSSSLSSRLSLFPAEAHSCRHLMGGMAEFAGISICDAYTCLIASLPDAQGHFSSSAKLDVLAEIVCFASLPSAAALLPPCTLAHGGLHALAGLWVWPWALSFALHTWGHAGRRPAVMRRCPGLLLPNLPSSSFVSLPLALSCHPSPLLFIITSSPGRPYLGAVFEFSPFFFFFWLLF